MTAGSQSGYGAADVERWPTEMPRFARSGQGDHELMNQQKVLPQQLQQQAPPQ